jgi:hypothetical protein
MTVRNLGRRQLPLGLTSSFVSAVLASAAGYLATDVESALSAGIPCLDITRWTERVRGAAAIVDAAPSAAPVMLASGWMAGVAAVLGAALSRQLERTDSIDISVLYSLKDKAGPNSTEYMDRLATPFEVTIDGRPTMVRPYTDPRRVAFPGGRTAKAYRFDRPDQLTRPAATGAATVAARIAFDSAASTGLLVALTRSGIWKLMSGDRFTPLRRKLLYNPGDGASHEIVIEAEGAGHGGRATAVRATVADPAGQTHLTAVGATIQLERLLGLDGAPPPEAGIVYPDTAPQVGGGLQALRDAGVEGKLQRRVSR